MAEATEAAEARGRDRISVRKGERVRVEAQIGRCNFLTIIMSIGEGEEKRAFARRWQSGRQWSDKRPISPNCPFYCQEMSRRRKEGRKEGRKEQDERRGGFGGIGRTRQLSNS